MYGKIQPVSELPKDANIYGGGTYTHFFTVMLFGLTYYIPIRKGSKTVIEKMGMDKVEDFTRDIINAVKLQVKDVVASEVHKDLMNQIEDGFGKMFSNNLFKTITDGMDNKQKLLEGNSDVYLPKVKLVVCRLYTARKHCKEYKYNKKKCIGCPHNIKKVN